MIKNKTNKMTHSRSTRRRTKTSLYYDEVTFVGDCECMCMCSVLTFYHEVN